MQRSAAAAPKSKANTAAAAAATAVAEEEARQRETAAARIREAAGESAPADSETHWQLSTTAPRAGPKDTVIKFALSELRDVDSGSEAEEEEGRLVFGGFRKKEEKKAEPEDSDSEDDDSEDEGKAKTPKTGKKKKTADVSLAGADEHLQCWESKQSIKRDEVLHVRRHRTSGREVSAEFLL